MLAAGVLAGWLFEIPWLASAEPTLRATRPPTAIGFGLSGGALLLLSGRPGRARRALGRGVALLVAALGLSTFVLLVFGWTPPPGADGIAGALADALRSASDRMAPTSAAAFLLTGAGLFALDVEDLRPVPDVVGFALLLIAFLPLVGYAYGAAALYGFPGRTEIALNTAAGFAVLGTGLLCVRPEGGFVGFVSGPGAGPLTARLLMPAALFLPFLVGFIIVHGLPGGSEGRMAESLIVVFTTTLSLAGIGLAARRIDVVDRERVKLRGQRDHLMAVIGHDLRNAASTLMGATAVLAREEIDRPEWERNSLDAIRSSTDQIQRLIRDLAGIRTIDREGLEIRPRVEPLEGVVSDAAEAARYAREWEGLTLDVRCSDGGTAVRVDRDRILEALGNILRNAAEHSPPEGRVTLRTTRAGERVRVTVADDGPGIPDEDLPHVFERFWTGDSTDEGAGLGLAIAREIVAAHGGTIDVECPPEGGTRVRMELPVVSAPDRVHRDRTQPPRTAAERPAREPDGRRPRGSEARSNVGPDES